MDLYFRNLPIIFCDCNNTPIASGINVFTGFLGGNSAIGVVNDLDIFTNFFNKSSKSVKNVFPNITGSVAYLSPKYISLDCIIVLGVSTFKLFNEFKFIVSNELNNILSLLALNNILPEFITTCSLSNTSVATGDEKYEL